MWLSVVPVCGYWSRMTDPTRSEVPWPEGTSDMARCVREHRWALTPLGPMRSWSPTLRTAVESMLLHPSPVTLHWGEDLTLLFNDPFVSMLSRPAALSLGRPTLDVFTAFAEQIASVMGRARSGRSFTLDDQRFRRHVDGDWEDCWYDLAHEPVRDPQGTVVGVMVVGTETTERVEFERRKRFADSSRGSVA